MTPPDGDPDAGLTLAKLAHLLDAAFPAETRASLGALVSVDRHGVRLRLDPTPAMLRPGGIVSGPAQMALVDVAAYAAILARHGAAARMAVTHALSITFLRACAVEPIFADARPLKIGRRLASIDVRLWQGAEDRLIAQASVGYAMA